MRKYKVFVGGDIYSIVEADGWNITSQGDAIFLQDGEPVITYDRNEWYFVEVQN